MLENEKISIQGTEYVIGRLDLFKALDVSRRIGPVLPMIFSDMVEELAEVIRASHDDKTATLEERLNDYATLLSTCGPVLQCIAGMKKEDFDFVLKTCLGAVERKTESGYARLMQGDRLMFADVDQVTALRLIFRVLARELRPMFAAPGL